MPAMDKYVFGVLLPVKIEGKELSRQQSMSLRALAATCPCHHTCVIQLGIDEEKRNTRAVEEIKMIFQKHDIKVRETYFDDNHKGEICYFWRKLAEDAVKVCDFFCLLGDDVELHSSHWIDNIINDFKSLHTQLALPKEFFGFGCIALTDRQAKGFPTFPVLHKIHFELNGELFSNKFINQDADPFLFQLYRRFGASVFSENVQLTNHVGGVQVLEDTSYVAPRYDRKHIKWSDDLLTEAVMRVNDKLNEYKSLRCVTVDVVVPTYRVTESFLKRICSLKSARKDVNVYFIVIVDNPKADVSWLKNLANSRTDLRVRVNSVNQGASYTRNVGMDESAADFILFLDDDVIPQDDIIDKYVEAALQHGDEYDGFVGYSELPNKPWEIFPTAVHFSGVSFFWRAALKMKRVPWGITANLFVRRISCPRFDIQYIKTGGGEDIDFCLKLRKQPLLAVPEAKVLHPWWDNGARCYKHFFNWSFSDGMLQDFYPSLTYRCLPDAVEFSILVIIGLALCKKSYCVVVPLSVLIADALIDLFELWNSSAEPYSKGLTRCLAILESTLIKNTSCIGHLYGHWNRGKFFANYCKRFDWFCGLNASVVSGEKKKALWRFLGFTAAVFVTHWIFS